MTFVEGEDLFRDTGGALVEYGSQTTYGHLIEEDEGVVSGPMGFEVRAGAISLLISTGALTGITQGETITVNGWGFKIRESRQERGGDDTRIWLQEVGA